MKGKRFLLALSLLPFILLATLNSAGYRYGASDQAFYAPAVLKRADPALVPRDSALIDSQARLTLVDDVVGPLARVSGVSLPVLFAMLHLAALGDTSGVLVDATQESDMVTPLKAPTPPGRAGAKRS